MDRHRSSLIQRVTMVMPIADALLKEGMIHAELYSNIQAARTSQDADSLGRIRGGTGTTLSCYKSSREAGREKIGCRL